MADPVLHIKDSFYFEVPKVLYPYEYRGRTQFSDVWISLDPEFQRWEADRLYDTLTRVHAELPPKEQVIEDWQHYVHADHANFAKPLKVFLNEKYEQHLAAFKQWKKAEIAAAKALQDGSDEAKQKLQFSDYIQHLESKGSDDHEYFEFLNWRHRHEDSFQRAAGKQHENVAAWKADKDVAEWSAGKIAAYNHHLSGKILIPQPFATLRNLYEKEEGVAISKYLVIEVFVGLVLIVIFSRLAAKMQTGGAPRGKVWNLLETFLVFIRDQIVRPSIGSHHHEEEAHAEHGHKAGEPAREHSPAHEAAQATGRPGGLPHGPGGLPHGPGGLPHAHHAHADPSNKFLPLFWTIFFFVLGCNLMGMVPWAGAPTAAFAVTAALAAVTFVTVLVSGMIQFGPIGFFLNQVPGMDLPWYMAIVIKPMILLIELLGLCIKHGVLAVRLLANMVAGHLVILGIMALAFGAEAALQFSDKPGWLWGLTAIIAVVASAAFSLLELFVAFLQAYIITFLSALFVGAAIHKH